MATPSKDLKLLYSYWESRDCTFLPQISPAGRSRVAGLIVIVNTSDAMHIPLGGPAFGIVNVTIQLQWIALFEVPSPGRKARPPSVILRSAEGSGCERGLAVDSSSSFGEPRMTPRPGLWALKNRAFPLPPNWWRILLLRQLSEVVAHVRLGPGGRRGNRHRTGEARNPKPEIRIKHE